MVRYSILVLFVLLIAPLAASQPVPPRPMPVDREELVPAASTPERSGTIGDFEINVSDQTQQPPSGSGGIDTTINFSVTYIGSTFGNPGTSLDFFAYGVTELVYDGVSFGCDEPGSEMDERLFTGGSIEASICFTVHPDDANVLSLGVAMKTGDDDTIWLATTDESVAGAPIVAVPVSIIMRDDFTFEPDSITIPADTNVSISVTNEGFMQHGLEISETGFATELLSNGETETLVVNLPPGTYTFICPVAGHAQSGMGGTIIVESSGTSSADGEAAEPDVSETVTVTAFDDFSFTPDAITIPADVDAQITVTNEGFMQHDFIIEDTEYGTSLLNAGESEDLFVNLTSGTYRIICSVPGHEASGMVGTLIVEQNP